MGEREGLLAGSNFSARDAVRIKRLYARYNDEIDVLKNVDFVVKTGSVCVLLGASGAGKSTLLKSIIGQVEGEAAQFSIFENSPLEQRHLIGYMPQINGLISDLTVVEMWTSFAHFYAMPEDAIKSRILYLLDLLSLKEQSNQTCGTLSGGQKQRCSLGIALISSPPLLVLDEPMTGLDPVLRQKLWNHLRMLSAKHHTTIVMASQYFEMACDADNVSIIHEGLLLVQDSPGRIVGQWADMYETQSRDPTAMITCEEINSAYDNICRTFETQNVISNSAGDYRLIFTCGVDIPHAAIQEPTMNTEDPYGGEWIPHARSKNEHGNLKSLSVRPRVCKSIIQTHTKTYYRHCFSLLILLIIPVIELLIYNMIMGHNIKRIEIGVFSEDTGYMVGDTRQYLSDFTVDTFRKYNDYTIVNLTCAGCHGRSVAQNGVESGDLHASILFSKKYSTEIYEASPLKSDMHMSLFLDTSAPVIASQISEDVYHAFQETERQAGRPTRDALSFISPIFGSMKSRFSDYLAAGLVGMTPLVNGFVIGLAEMTKREEDEIHVRYRVAAVTDAEFLFGNILGFASIHVPQSIFLLCMFAVIFDYSFTAASFVLCGCVVLGLVAVSLTMSVMGGMLVRTQFDAIMLMMVWFIPFMLLCGLFWPLEAQPYGFRWMAMLMPTTWGVSTFRAFLLKSFEAGVRNLTGHIFLCILWTVTMFRISLVLNRNRTKKIDVDVEVPSSAVVSKAQNTEDW